MDMSSKKLCGLVKKGAVKEDKKQYKELVRDGQFLCKKCGRVAKNDKNLCKPTDL